MRTLCARLLIAITLSAAIASILTAIDARDRRISRERAEQQIERAARLPFADRHYPAFYLDLRNAYIEATR